MPVNWIARNRIDEAKWNACTASCPQTDSVCARLWYLDGCGEQWDALVEDDYRAVMPLFWRKKFGIRYIYPPFFTGQIGILGNPAVGITEWLDAIPKHFLRREIIFNALNDKPEKGRIIRHRTCLLPLQPDYGTLRAGYSPNHIRNLKKAEQSGLQISHEADFETVIKWFRQQRAGQRQIGYKERDYQRLIRLLELLQEHQALEIWKVTDAEQNECAAAFFAFSNRRHTFLFSGRTAGSERNRAMFFLMDRFIRSHAGTSALLDFNGSNNPAVARFYTGFGAQFQDFYQINRGIAVF